MQRLTSRQSTLASCNKDYPHVILRAPQVAPVVKNLPANAGDVRDADSIPGSGKSPGGGNGNPLRYSCLENPMDRGAWWATVHRVTKSRTRLKQLSMHTCMCECGKLMPLICETERSRCLWGDLMESQLFFLDFQSIFQRQHPTKACMDSPWDTH